MQILTLLPWEPASGPLPLHYWMSISRETLELLPDEMRGIPGPPPLRSALPGPAQVKDTFVSHVPWMIHLPFLFTVKCGLLKPFCHRCFDADIWRLSSSLQYGILHMSPTITPYVFRESEDLFPSKSLLLALPPSLPNCQAMNFNLEELLHLSL